MALARGGASRSGSASLTLAPFTTEVECKGDVVRRISSPMTLLDPTGAPDAVRFSALRSTAEISVEAANPHRGSSRAKGLRCQACLFQAKLSRNSNQIARGRIRRFESYMPSQPVRSPTKMAGAAQAEFAPNVTRAAVFRDTGNPSGNAQFGAFPTPARSSAPRRR